MLYLLALPALAAYVSAQSSSCTGALTTVALNADAAACLNTVALVSIVSGNSSTSIVPAISNWLTGVCGSPACSNETLAAVISNITTGCTEEFASYGFTSESVPEVTAAIQEYYPTARKLLCLKDGNDNCVTKTLQTIEGVIGTLSLENIIGNVVNSSLTIADADDIVCTDCFKAAYNVITEDHPGLKDNRTTTAIEGQCGASFTDGQTPANIVQSATNGRSSSTSAALGAFQSLFLPAYLGLATSFVAVSISIFALLL